MSSSWADILYDGAERATFAAVAHVLADRFPSASEAVLSLQARQLVFTTTTACDLVTRRADDAKAIQKLAVLMRGADSIVQGLSKPTREAVLHRLYMAGSSLSFDQVASIVEDVGSGIDETPFSSRENVKAILLVDDARRVWSGHLGAAAPDAGLNPASPFALFLADLFAALNVGAEPRSAFQAWRKYRASGLF